MTAPLSYGYVNAVTVKLALQIPNFSYGTDVIWVWDAATLKLIAPPRQHEGSVWAVAFSPDGKMIATADRKSVV